MEHIDITKILNRSHIESEIISILKNFEENKKTITIKRAIYLYGNHGTGKSYLVKSILKKLNYDIILYDAGDIRNKNIIDTITNHNMPDTNVLSMFKKQKRKLAIVMDEIDGMNNGDKGGLNTLIKLIRPKKNKRTNEGL
jgi:Cdc6-like AAA superfamily ATPase